jgi:hypothetical protein
VLPFRHLESVICWPLDFSVKVKPSNGQTFVFDQSHY